MNTPSAFEIVMTRIGSGDLDAYDVMTNPKTPAEVQASADLQRRFDSKASKMRLHPDDDFEEILDLIADDIEAEYPELDRGGFYRGTRYTTEDL